MKSPHSSRRELRGNPFLREQVHDPYRMGEKLRESTYCPQCGVRYRNGRWVWPKTPTAGVRAHVCPACQRINDHYPAGEITLSGSFLPAHRAEILSRARNIETAERNEHPLHRIIAIAPDGEHILITTTDIHLPHRIGHALKDAWGGGLSTHYDLEGHFTRVEWERND